MRRVRARVAVTTAVAASASFLVGTLTVLQPIAHAQPEKTAEETSYLVLLKGTGLDSAAERAIKRAGGRVTEVNTKVGYAYVKSRSARFASAVAASSAVEAAVAERVVGRALQFRRPSASEIERLTEDAKHVDAKAGQADAETISTKAAIDPEPLANLQWDMRMIGATATGSYAKNQGKGVRVGIIDTGIDGSHPDIAPNFSARLSRNFVTDMPDVDGPCEVASCVDPADVDDNDHGTHVASTIGSPLNGLGIAGVAPKATLINIRAG